MGRPRDYLLHPSDAGRDELGDGPLFGSPDAGVLRRWVVPREHELHYFRRAAVQHCVAVFARRLKKKLDITRHELSRDDPRPNAEGHWKNVLTGHAWMDLEDPLFIARRLGPQVVPSWDYIAQFVDVVEHGAAWPFPEPQSDMRFTS